jgi:type IV pilus assembly protein PilQ
MKKRLVTSYAMALMVGIFAFFACGLMETMAQQLEATEPEMETPQPSREPVGSEFVTINVKDANISEVLKAYSLQTGQSIVVGPDVVSENVNVRLNNIPWQEALDVILKPYGFGYRVVGDTIVISKLENIVTVEGIEPLVSKIINLKYLDAYDMKDLCEAQLSSRGKISILKSKGLPGWEFGGGSDGGSSSSQTGMGTVRREEADPIQKSKVLLVTDVPSNVSQIEKVLEELDQIPSQVLIEARFLEIDSSDLVDIGVDFATGIDGLSTAGVQPATDGKNRWGADQNDSFGLTPAAFDPLAETLSGQLDYNSGLQLLYSKIGGTDFEVLIHALEENGDVNILSAPRILTQNNQEAAILVGKKFPIIESQSNSGGSVSAVTSTSLSYYENIGIQLNVIPQVCADNYINMIVHPTVSSIDGFESGIVSQGDDIQSGTRYPILKIREAQTQILLKSQDTVAIGGLQSEVDKESSYGVPFLKDIPFLGRLFRRETTTTSKLDLLILIKASIVDNDSYGSQSQQFQQMQLENMGMQLEQESPEALEIQAVEPEEVSIEEVIGEMESVVEEEDIVAAEEVVAAEEILAAEEVVAEEADDAVVENAEILALVNSMDEPTTNDTANAEM